MRQIDESGTSMKSICVYLCLSVVPLLAAVDGTVVNKTTGQPQAGATVTLYKLGQAGMESVVSVKSGAQGKFHIDQTPQGPHLIQTAFDGVTYNHMLPPGSATSGLSLDVYNSSRQPGAARISRHFLIFQPNGAQMSVNEGFIFTNNGTTTYNDPDGGTLKFYLPTAAKGIVQVKATAPQGMPIDRAADKTNLKDIYKIDFPIKPGETSIQVSYLVPYSSGAVFEGKTVGKTEEPTLLVVPNGVTLKGEGVENRGQEPRSQASVYSVKTATYKVEIAGSMPAAAATDAESGDNGPSLEEVSPKILRYGFVVDLGAWKRRFWPAEGSLDAPSLRLTVPWVLPLTATILALGFIVLYRAQPALTPAALKAQPVGERAPAMSLPDLLFSFEGRITREAWWGYFVPYFLIYVCLFGVGTSSGSLFLPAMYGLVMLYPTLAVNVKRCHDRGRSGLFVLIGCVPVLGFWYLVEICLLPGTTGRNQYGPDPKGAGAI